MADTVARKAQRTRELEQRRGRAVCKQCGGPFALRASGSGGWGKLYCGDICAKRAYSESPAGKAAKRKHRAARKAKERAATVEAFDPIAILERDGWRCQICGVQTPRKLRGTFKPNAPEVDHIVSLADGGAHAPWNVQCACRSCNLGKADGPPAGQIGLFTSLTPCPQNSQPP